MPGSTICFDDLLTTNRNDSTACLKRWNNIVTALRALLCQPNLNMNKNKPKNMALFLESFKNGPCGLKRVFVRIQEECHQNSPNLTKVY